MGRGGSVRRIVAARYTEGLMAGPAKPPLRAITYLSPGIPLEFFELVTRYLARSVGREPRLESDGRISGPMHGEHDPFASG